MCQIRQSALSSIRNGKEEHHGRQRTGGSGHLARAFRNLEAPPAATFPRGERPKSCGGRGIPGSATVSDRRTIPPLPTSENLAANGKITTNSIPCPTIGPCSQGRHEKRRSAPLAGILRSRKAQNTRTTRFAPRRCADRCRPSSNDGAWLSRRKRAFPMAHAVESLFNHSVRLVGFPVAGVSAGSSRSRPPIDQGPLAVLIN